MFYTFYEILMENLLKKPQGFGRCFLYYDRISQVYCVTGVDTDDSINTQTAFCETAKCAQRLRVATKELNTKSGDYTTLFSWINYGKNL